MTLIHGEALEELKKMPDDSVDSIVTDPPAGISFMGKVWDHNKGGRDSWIKWLSEIMVEGLRVLKPGGHALVWALPRTSHWTAMALEDAGFEIRDCIYHIFGSGFPKSLDISKAIDKSLGFKGKIIGPKVYGDNKECHYVSKKALENSAGKSQSGKTSHPPLTVPISESASQWHGWGTALKPAVECWWLCRKPLSEKTVAANVMRWGTGGINIDKCRIKSIGSRQKKVHPSFKKIGKHSSINMGSGYDDGKTTLGRFPAHLIHDGSEEVLGIFPETKSGAKHGVYNGWGQRGIYGKVSPYQQDSEASSGSAARFFYCSKADRSERNDGLNEQSNHHPTVKPLALMRYLVRLITPPSGIVLDYFMGSGSTGIAAIEQGFDFIGIEIDAEYFAIAQARLAAVPPRLPFGVRT